MPIGDDLFRLAEQMGSIDKENRANALANQRIALEQQALAQHDQSMAMRLQELQMNADEKGYRWEPNPAMPAGGNFTRLPNDVIAERARARAGAEGEARRRELEAMYGATQGVVPGAAVNVPPVPESDFEGIAASMGGRQPEMVSPYAVGPDRKATMVGGREVSFFTPQGPIFQEDIESDRAARQFAAQAAQAKFGMEQKRFDLDVAKYMTEARLSGDKQEFDLLQAYSNANEVDPLTQQPKNPQGSKAMATHLAQYWYSRARAATDPAERQAIVRKLTQLHSQIPEFFQGFEMTEPAAEPSTAKPPSPQPPPGKAAPSAEISDYLKGVKPSSGASVDWREERKKSQERRRLAQEYLGK